MNVPRLSISGLGVTVPPGCPYDQAASDYNGSPICTLSGGQQVGCNLIRECDPMTGSVHFEYTLPGGSGSPNADILEVNPITLQPTGYQNANAEPTAVPTYYAQAWSPSIAQTGNVQNVVSSPAVVNPPPVPAIPLSVPPVVPVTVQPTQQQVSAPSPTAQPTQQQISQTASAQTSGTMTLPSFLTESMFGGIPNWALLAGVAGIAFIFMRGK